MANPKRVEKVQNLRRSNASGPMKSKKAYNKKERINDADMPPRVSRRGK